MKMRLVKAVAVDAFKYFFLSYQKWTYQKNFALFIFFISGFINMNAEVISHDHKNYHEHAQKKEPCQMKWFWNEKTFFFLFFLMSHTV